MVASKTIGKNRRNHGKIKKFCLEAKKAKKSSTSAPMRSHPTTNKPQEFSGPSRTPSQQTTSAPNGHDQTSNPATNPKRGISRRSQLTQNGQKRK